jgi:hypothetical protein
MRIPEGYRQQERRMPDYDRWDVIVDVEAGQTVLGFDFPSARRSEAGFTELAGLLGTRYRFLRARPLTARPGQRLSASAYLGPWLEEIRRDQRPVGAVLGCRVGSVYAVAAAQAIAQWQPTPQVIVFDPELASPELLGAEFSDEISAITSLLSDDEIEAARQITAGISGLADREPGSRGTAGVAERMMERFLDVIEIPFERAGLGGARHSKLTETFESYISWISAADQLRPAVTGERTTVIMSSDYAAPSGNSMSGHAWPLRGESAGSPSDVPGGRPCRTISCDVSHADLLRRHSVAATVLGLLDHQLH